MLTAVAQNNKLIKFMTERIRLNQNQRQLFRQISVIEKQPKSEFQYDLTQKIKSNIFNKYAN